MSLLCQSIFHFRNKKINCSIKHFLNDDIDSPTNLIGAKQVPILEKDNGEFMAESLSIIEYLDGLDGNRVLAPTYNRTELNEWINRTQMIIRQLMMPRWVQFNEPEFKTQSARDYFTRNKERMIGSFAANLEKAQN